MTFFWNRRYYTFFISSALKDVTHFLYVKSDIKVGLMRIIGGNFLWSCLLVLGTHKMSFTHRYTRPIITFQKFNISLYASGKWILDIIWPMYQQINLKNKGIVKKVWQIEQMLKFWNEFYVYLLSTEQRNLL